MEVELDKLLNVVSFNEKGAGGEVNMVGTISESKPQQEPSPSDPAATV